MTSKVSKYNEQGTNLQRRLIEGSKEEDAMKINKIINTIQFINWAVTCSLILYFIFVSGTNKWFITLEIGLAIQFGLLICNWILGVRINAKWAVYDLVLALLISFVELENYGLITTKFFRGEAGYATIYLFILVVALGFLLSFRQIRNEFKKDVLH